VSSLGGKASVRRGSRLLTVSSGAGATRPASACEAGPQHDLAGQTPGRWPGEGGVLGKLLCRALPHRCSRTLIRLSLRVVAVTGVGSRQWIHFLCRDAHSLLSDGAGEHLQLVL